MHPDELILTAGRVILDTVLYLLAYRGAPLVALVAAALLAGWAPAERLRNRATAGTPLARVLAASALGFVRPLGPTALRRDLAAIGPRADVVAYLAASHGLTLYYLLLMGPLLGKDVLLSHVIGGLLFAATAGAGVRLVGLSVEALSPGNGTPGPSVANGARAERTVSARTADANGHTATRMNGETGWSAAVAETGRGLGLMILGLILGGIIAAWGLSGRAAAPVEIVTTPWLAQLLNALIGVGAAVLLWMWPVENLFVGTYLWKIGLGHAGLVAFFWACTLSPHRLRLYRDLWGVTTARRFAAILAVAAIAAGMATALVYRVTPLSINYKLIPTQMW